VIKAIFAVHADIHQQTAMKQRFSFILANHYWTCSLEESKLLQSSDNSKYHKHIGELKLDEQLEQEGTHRNHNPLYVVTIMPYSLNVSLNDKRTDVATINLICEHRCLRNGILYYPRPDRYF
jgi:hypothetical protein